jgi:hypothetical protein
MEARMTVTLTIETVEGGSLYAGGTFGINAIGDTREAVIEEAEGQARDLAEARGVPVPTLTFA